MTRLTIDGIEVRAEEGTSVLDAARSRGIHIPTLCHHDALADVGACRVCVVEVTYPGGRSTVTASCTLPVSEGLQVQTRSDRALRTRRMMVELLLARAPGSATMQTLAAEVGIEKSRFDVPDAGNCVLCGRCVRACAEHAGVATTAFSGRGRERKVTTPFERESEVCLGCGSCVQVCPTGALSLDQQDDRRRVMLRGRVVRSVEMVRCDHCGQAYTTVPWLDWVRTRVGADRLGMQDEHVCPRCSRRIGAQREAASLRTKRASMQEGPEESTE